MADLKYSKAVEKLDEIIEQIENENIDVDDLSVKVKEAVKLIKTCKDKIDKAEMDVKKVVKEFKEKDE